ncbi:MAG TPA: aldo/keto reductase [Ilumatobacteraceae bacterium]|jgi:aryl-alcohol dehydrogenase-like predicted oxidoreductase
MLPTNAFGRTGHQSTRVIFGAAALGSMSQQSADATIELFDSHGVNHIDTARSYGDSELRLAPWLKDNRGKVFLATKTGDRSGSGGRRELEESLSRLGVDHVDLIQLHNLVEPEEWDVAFAAGGVVDAMTRARDEGLCRFIGVTGHGVRIPAMHLRSLRAFDFDSVLFPYNFTMLDRPDYRADVDALLELCAERNVAVQTIKSVARGRWSGSRENKFSWYEPLTDPAAISRGVRFVLSNSQLFLNSSSDATLLPAILAAAEGDLTAPSADELRDDVATFGITALFDGDALERI